MAKAKAQTEPIEPDAATEPTELIVVDNPTQGTPCGQSGCDEPIDLGGGYVFDGDHYYHPEHAPQGHTVPIIETPADIDETNDEAGETGGDDQSEADASDDIDPDAA